MSIIKSFDNQQYFCSIVIFQLVCELLMLHLMLSEMHRRIIVRSSFKSLTPKDPCVFLGAWNLKTPILYLYALQGVRNKFLILFLISNRKILYLSQFSVSDSKIDRWMFTIWEIITSKVCLRSFFGHCWDYFWHFWRLPL